MNLGYHWDVLAYTALGHWLSAMNDLLSSGIPVSVLGLVTLLLDHHYFFSTERIEVLICGNYSQDIKRKAEDWVRRWTWITNFSFRVSI